MPLMGRAVGEDCISNQVRANKWPIFSVYYKHIRLNEFLEVGIVTEQLIRIGDGDRNKLGEVLFEKMLCRGHAPYKRFAFGSVLVFLIHFQLINVNQRMCYGCMSGVHHIIC